MDSHVIWIMIPQLPSISGISVFVFISKTIQQWICSEAGLQNSEDVEIRLEKFPYSWPIFSY